MIERIRQSQKYQMLLIFVSWLIVVLVIICPWQLYFLNDDFMHIPDQRIGLRSGFFRPMPELLVALDKWTYGTKAWGFFITTSILFLLCSLAAYRLFRLILRKFLPQIRGSVPLVTTLIFILYPWHAEPLMWIIGRVAILATFFSLLSLSEYIRATAQPWRIATCLFWFMLALLTYESIWSVWAVFGIISVVNIKMRLSTIKKEALRFLLVTALFFGYLFFRLNLLGTVAGDGYDEVNQNLGSLSLVVSNWLKLLLRVYTPPFNNSVYFVGAAVGITIVLVAGTMATFKKHRNAGISVVLLQLAMAGAVLTAAPLGIDTHYGESERYLFFASAFFCFLLVLMISVLFSTRGFKVAVVLLSFVFFVLLYYRSSDYRKASVVTSTTIEVVAKNVSPGTAFFINVPKREKGAMLFRICLPNAITWLVPQANFENVIIFSQVEQAQVQQPFGTGSISLSQLRSKMKPAEFDSLTQGYDAGQDRIFFFAPNGLFVVR